MEVRPEAFELGDLTLEEAVALKGQLIEMADSQAYSYMRKMMNAIVSEAYLEILNNSDYGIIQLAKGQILGLESYARCIDEQIEALQIVIGEEKAKMKDMEGIDEEEIGS